MASKPTGKALLFGDPWGISMLMRALSPEQIMGIVGAVNHGEQHRELNQTASRLGVPFLVLPKEFQPEFTGFINDVSRIAPNWLLINSFGQLIPEELIKLPRGGAVNAHSGILPQFRGNHIHQWCILNEERFTGVTIHHLAATFDSGPIIAMEKVPIRFSDTWIDLQKRVVKAKSDMLCTWVPRILAGDTTSHPQSMEKAHYWPRRSPEQGEIRWEKSVREIYNLVRALVHPLPGAFYFRNRIKVVVDHYLTMPEITALKFQACDSEVWSDNKWFLHPLTIRGLEAARANGVEKSFPMGEAAGKGDKRWLEDLESSHSHLVMEVRGAGGHEIEGFGCFRDLDYERRDARLELIFKKDAPPAVRGLLVEFAKKELGLFEVF